MTPNISVHFAMDHPDIITVLHQKPVSGMCIYEVRFEQGLLSTERRRAWRIAEITHVYSRGGVQSLLRWAKGQDKTVTVERVQRQMVAA